jgi:hypothetical protein
MVSVFGTGYFECTGMGLSELLPYYFCDIPADLARLWFDYPVFIRTRNDHPSDLDSLTYFISFLSWCISGRENVEEPWFSSSLFIVDEGNMLLLWLIHGVRKDLVWVVITFRWWRERTCSCRHQYSLITRADELPLEGEAYVSSNIFVLKGIECGFMVMEVLSGLGTVSIRW